MSIRIRYQKTSDPSTFRSVKNFRTVIDGKARTLYVVYNETNLGYAVRDANSGETISSGGGTKSRTVLFRKIKRELEALGVQFGLEERKRDG